jgi:ankyrin repeat domain-containing protein 13
MIEVDHEKREVYTEQMRMISAEELQLMQPSQETIAARLTTPIVTTYIDTEKISFERNKSGLWGWRADKVEEVNGHECKVFAANNVELLTKTRIEHLSAADRAKSYIPKSPLQSFLGIAESEERAHSPTKDANVVSIFLYCNFLIIFWCSIMYKILFSNFQEEYKHKGNPSNISVQDYFSTVDLEGRDIGRPKELNAKVQKFRVSFSDLYILHVAQKTYLQANLWLAEKYPLTLPEQIMPIVDLMAISSTHFAKLKDFIQMQLPAGFPVKIGMHFKN